MVPILYDLTSDDSLYLGKGKLADAISCIDYEVMNGEWELELKYPITGCLAESLIQGMQVLAHVPSYQSSYSNYWKHRDPHFFDIYSKALDENGVITIKANHASRRLSRCIMPTYQSQPALLLQYSYPTRQVADSVWYDIDGIETTLNFSGTDGTTPAYKSPKSILGILIGSEGSYAADRGLELAATTYFRAGKPRMDVSMLTRGGDHGAQVHFGVNMLSLDKQFDMSGAYNAVIPYWEDGAGNVTYANGYVVQPTTPITPVVAVPLDCSGVFDTGPTSAQLVAYARNHLDTKSPWTGKDTIQVDFVNDDVTITNDELNMGDTVHVYWGDADIAVDMRIVAYKYDVLAERYISMELGSPQTQFVAVTGDSNAGASGAWGGSCNSDYRIYNSVTDIGLTSGSATIANAFSAMPDFSILCCSAGEFATSAVPSGFYGAVWILKNANIHRSYIEAKGSMARYGDWRMFLDSNGAPTGTWTQNVTANDVEYKIFDSVTDIGLTSGSATIAGAWSALPYPAILLCSANQFASSERPISYGNIMICKVVSASGPIFAFGKDANDGVYRMGVNSSNVPNGTWVRETNNGMFTVARVDKSASATSIPGYLSTSWSVSKSGYTPIAMAGFSAGNSYVYFSNAHLDGNTFYAEMRTSTGGTVNAYPYVSVLYLKS